ncbi:MAG: ABC transporter substrate-binding protein [Chloroflexota bacterium]|nr:ABC transporter substrate-binding protein [Chloroflexota bacterium]
MHHAHKRIALVGTVLATTALTFSGIGVAADSHLTGYAELDQAMNGDFAGTKVTMQTQWVGGEGDNFEAAFAAFEEATGIDISVAEVPSGQHETLVNVSLKGGAASDLLVLAQPAIIKGYGQDGLLVDVATIMDTEKLAAEQPALSTYQDGESIWAIPYKFDVKSVVWYPIKAFEAAGYAVPTTWDELIALSDRIVADGTSPWCIAMEAGPATGWIATDWVEDVMLRTAGIDAYNAWAAGELKFDSPEVRAALDKVAQIFFTDGYVYGGSTAILATNQTAAMDPMWGPAFDSLDAPDCWMQKQATWYGPDFFPDKKAGADESAFVIGEDVGLFYLPPIDAAMGTPALSAGDGIMVTSDRPEVRAAAQFFATPAGIEAWIKAGSAISPNSTTPVEWSEGNYKLETAAGIIANSTALGFDASDLMPGHVGAGSFWTGMVDWISADGENTDSVLQAIDASWEQ